MQRAIDKNKLLTIRSLVPLATLEDLDYANKKNNIEAAFLILENDKVSLELYNRCKDKLSIDEKIYLCRGTNPKDIASIIFGLSKI